MQGRAPWVSHGGHGDSEALPPRPRQLSQPTPRVLPGVVAVAVALTVATFAAAVDASESRYSANYTIYVALPSNTAAHVAEAQRCAVALAQGDIATAATDAGGLNASVVALDASDLGATLLAVLSLGTPDTCEAIDDGDANDHATVPVTLGVVGARDYAPTSALGVVLAARGTPHVSPLALRALPAHGDTPLLPVAVTGNGRPGSYSKHMLPAPAAVASAVAAVIGHFALSNRVVFLRAASNSGAGAMKAALTSDGFAERWGSAVAPAGTGPLSDGDVQELVVTFEEAGAGAVYTLSAASVSALQALLPRLADRASDTQLEGDSEQSRADSDDGDSDPDAEGQVALEGEGGVVLVVDMDAAAAAATVLRAAALGLTGPRVVWLGYPSTAGIATMGADPDALAALGPGVTAQEFATATDGFIHMAPGSAGGAAVDVADSAALEARWAVECSAPGSAVAAAVSNVTRSTGWLHVYDAVMALHAAGNATATANGYGAANADVDAAAVTPVGVMAALGATSLVGATGQLAFDDAGDRVGAGLELWNLDRRHGPAALVGAWTPTVPVNDDGTVSASASPWREGSLVMFAGGARGGPPIYWPGGSTRAPSFVPEAPPVVEISVEGVELHVMIAAAGVLACLALAVLCLLGANRQHTQIRSAYPSLMSATLLGVVVGCVFLVLLLMPASTAVCAAQKSAFVIGFVLVYVPLVLKAIRYYRLERATEATVMMHPSRHTVPATAGASGEVAHWHTLTGSRQISRKQAARAHRNGDDVTAAADNDISEWRLVLVLLAFTGLQALLLAIWFSEGTGADVLPSARTYSFGGFDDARYSFCLSRFTEPAPLILAMMNALVIVASLVLAMYTRASDAEFPDARLLKQAISNSFVVGGATAGVMTAFGDHPLDTPRVAYCGCYVGLLSTMVLAFTPHVRVLLEQQRLRGWRGLCGGRRLGTSRAVDSLAEQLAAEDTLAHNDERAGSSDDARWSVLRNATVTAFLGMFGPVFIVFKAVYIAAGLIFALTLIFAVVAVVSSHLDWLERGYDDDEDDDGDGFDAEVLLSGSRDLSSGRLDAGSRPQPQARGAASASSDSAPRVFKVSTSRPPASGSGGGGGGGGRDFSSGGGYGTGPGDADTPAQVPLIAPRRPGGKRHIHSGDLGLTASARAVVDDQTVELSPSPHRTRMAMPAPVHARVQVPPAADVNSAGVSTDKMAPGAGFVAVVPGETAGSSGVDGGASGRAAVPTAAALPGTVTAPVTLPDAPGPAPANASVRRPRTSAVHAARAMTMMRHVGALNPHHGANAMRTAIENSNITTQLVRVGPSATGGSSGGSGSGTGGTTTLRDQLEVRLASRAGLVYHATIAAASLAWMGSFIYAAYAMTAKLDDEGRWAHFEWSYAGMPEAHKMLEMTLYWCIGIDYMVRLYVSKAKVDHVFSLVGVGDTLALVSWVVVWNWPDAFINPNKGLADGAGASGADTLDEQHFVCLLSIGCFRFLRLRSLPALWSLMTDRTEADSRVQILELVSILCAAVFFMAGLVFIAEAPVQGDVWEWHDFVYFSVVTMSTVGYGDTTISTSSTRLCLVIIIAYVVLVVPDQASRISALVATSRRIMYMPGSRDSDVVLVVGPLGVRRTDAFLTEFYHRDRGHTRSKTVLLSALPATDPAMRALLHKPTLDGRVSYLQGSPLHQADMALAQAHRAASCFLVSMDAAEDETTVAHAMMVKAVLPRRASVYVQLVGSLAPDVAATAADGGVGWIHSDEDVRGAMLAKSIACPGFSTLLSNLLLTTASTSGAGGSARGSGGGGGARYGRVEGHPGLSSGSERDYLHGRGMEAYSVPVPERLVYLPFGAVASLLYSQFNLALCGVEVQVARGKGASAGRGKTGHSEAGGGASDGDADSDARGVPGGANINNASSSSGSSSSGGGMFLALNQDVHFPLLSDDKLLVLSPSKGRLVSALKMLESIIQLTPTDVSELAQATRGMARGAIDESEVRRFVSAVAALRCEPHLAHAIRTEYAAHVADTRARSRQMLTGRPTVELQQHSIGDTVTAPGVRVSSSGGGAAAAGRVEGGKGGFRVGPLTGTGDDSGLRPGGPLPALALGTATTRETGSETPGTSGTPGGDSDHHHAHDDIGDDSDDGPRSLVDSNLSVMDRLMRSAVHDASDAAAARVASGKTPRQVGPTSITSSSAGAVSSLGGEIGHTGTGSTRQGRVSASGRRRSQVANRDGADAPVLSLEQRLPRARFAVVPPRPWSEAVVDSFDGIPAHVLAAHWRAGTHGMAAAAGAGTLDSDAVASGGTVTPLSGAADAASTSPSLRAPLPESTRARAPLTENRHVVVVGDPGAVFPLVKYLRLKTEPRCRVIVWVMTAPLDDDAWAPLSQFPWLYVVVGMPNRRADMLRANADNAARIVLLASSHAEPARRRAADAHNVLTLHGMSLSQRRRAFIEYSSQEGFFLGDGPALEHFSHSPMFAAGSAWCADCTVTQALVHAHWSPQTMRFVQALLFGADTSLWEGMVPRLELVSLPRDFVDRMGIAGVPVAHPGRHSGPGERDSPSQTANGPGVHVAEAGAGRGGVRDAGDGPGVAEDSELRRTGSRDRNSGESKGDSEAPHSPPLDSAGSGTPSTAVHCRELFDALLFRCEVLPLGLYRYSRDTASWFVFANPPADTRVHRSDKVFVLTFAQGHANASSGH